ncbi:class I SAM-dependent DNA methyltransferase [Dokdonia ponticola]|uniref:site-specific DNA-methyltransferase (adenine-specific) n=1 Tax=Dokdonia ponticola TaxID=2041041 RepID=A0ABV9HXV8_9FLAO
MEISQKLDKGFQVLGFDKEKNDCLFLCQDINSIDDLELRIHLEKAIRFKADAVFFRKELDRFKPQIYLFDFTNELFNQNNLTDIQKKVWSNGTVPIVCAFYDAEIKILDCTQHIKKDNTPVYLASLGIVAIAHQLYNEQFAIKIKTGAFWEELENKNKFKFNSSAYDILIEWIKEIIRQSSNSKDAFRNRIVKKVIIQSIMIKYLEERKDENSNSPFNKKYVKKYDNAKDFVEVLEKNKLVNLLEDLQRDLNGNLFEWSEEEKEVIKLIDLSSLSEALKAYKKPEEINNHIFELIRFYEFSFIPVELISRIYEEFLAGDDDEDLNQKKKKRKEGIFYTPSHLAQLLVDESMPLKKYNEIDLSTYKILDPACGSGIFLVLAFKRLIQWWRLQNNLDNPNPKALKNLISLIYGVDKEQQATKLTAFSLCLALCDALNPRQIISDLKFIDLTENNVLHSDFFIDELIPPSENGEELLNEYDKQKENFQKINNIKFSLIIGNPPFSRSGSIKNSIKTFWEFNFTQAKIKIPSKQIALKFLLNSISLLEKDGLLCLIQKSANLLYNPTSKAFKKAFFQDYNVRQIFDFTHIYEKGLLWDNGARVATAAIFIQNSNISNQKNILHLIVRPTTQVKNRISFEVDDYDFNYINRQEAIDNPYVWKINLLGGGRLNQIIKKMLDVQNLDKFCTSNIDILKVGEGAGGGKTLSNASFDNLKIDYDVIDSYYLESYNKLKDKDVYEVPNLLLKEDVRLPLAINNKKIPFSNEIVGFSSKDAQLLKKISSYLIENNEILQCFLLSTSGKLFINKDTVITKGDIMNLPFKNDIINSFSDIEKVIIKETVSYYKDFLSRRNNSIVLEKISSKSFKKTLLNFGEQYINVLNLLYSDNEKRFRIDEVIEIYGGAYIASIFKYDDLKEKVKWGETGYINLHSMMTFDISKYLSSKRIIRLYHIKDTIVIIKPNQYRYWLSLSAYRDADKSIIDLSKMGY